MYPASAITSIQQSLTGLFFFAKSLCRYKCLVPPTREPKIDVIVKNHLESNIASVEIGHFTHRQLASGWAPKTAEDIIYRVRKGANKHPICGTTNGANWAKLRAIYTSIWIIDAFMCNREFHIFTAHVDEIYDMYEKATSVVIKLENKKNRVRQAWLNGYSHQIFKKVEKVARMVDSYVQYAEDIESHTVGRSVASTEPEENRFSINGEIEREGLDWVMRDEESRIGKWVY